MLGNWQDRVYQAAALDHFEGSHLLRLLLRPLPQILDRLRSRHSASGALAIPGGGMRTSVRLRTILAIRN